MEKIGFRFKSWQVRNESSQKMLKLSLPEEIFNYDIYKPPRFEQSLNILQYLTLLTIKRYYIPTDAFKS